ncbi:DUF1127 domain-containing protein [Pararhizobium haloflavum]|nr:DUF1127 domain-containing protein [Pararhizobium haloflavum]
MSMIASARAWLNHRRTMSQLRGLSNEALEDIGLTRYDVTHTFGSRTSR